MFSRNKLLAEGREDIIFYKKKVRHPDKVRLREKLKNFFNKEVINHIADGIYNFCETHQRFCLTITTLFFVTFLGLVIVKDFFAEKDLSLSFDILKLHINIGPEHKDNAVNLATFLVDFATLPLVVITIMFTAHSGYGDSNMQKSINTLDSKMDLVEGQMLQIIAQQKVAKSSSPSAVERITVQEIPQTVTNIITKNIEKT